MKTPKPCLFAHHTLSRGQTANQTQQLRLHTPLRSQPSVWVRVLDLREVVFVLGDVALHLLGDLILGIDRLHRALGLASPTVYALFGVDQELVPAVVDTGDGSL